MIGLLDTQAFMWADSDPSKLSADAVAFLQTPGNQYLVSVASLWEIVIKVHSGKLTLRAPLPNVVADQRSANRIRVLRVTLQHVLELQNLPPVHKDPFDRMLVAQAIAEGAVLISSDPIFAQYPVQVIW